MTANYIVGIEIAASFASLIAFIFVLLIFKKTINITPLWFFAFLALLSLTLLRIFIALEWMDIQASIMEYIQSTLYITLASFWLAFAYLTRSSVLKPV